MAKFFYFGLLALVAVTSAQQQTVVIGDTCDPARHSEIVSGCESVCGSNTCRLNSEGKPYCECATPPKVTTSDKKYQCLQHQVDMIDYLGPNYPGIECGSRCPQSGDATEAYDCITESEEVADKTVCVCSRPRHTAVKRGAAEDTELQNALDNLGVQVKTLLNRTLKAAQTLLSKQFLGSITRVIKALVNKCISLLNINLSGDD